MTREEALESGIRQAWWHVSDGAYENDVTLTAQFAVNASGINVGSPDDLEGFAVGLTMIAVEVAEIARKRREAAAGDAEVST